MKIQWQLRSAKQLGECFKEYVSLFDVECKSVSSMCLTFFWLYTNGSLSERNSFTVEKKVKSVF